MLDIPAGATKFKITLKERKKVEYGCWEDIIMYGSVEELSFDKDFLVINYSKPLKAEGGTSKKTHTKRYIAMDDIRHIDFLMIVDN